VQRLSTLLKAARDHVVKLQLQLGANHGGWNTKQLLKTEEERVKFLKEKLGGAQEEYEYADQHVEYALHTSKLIGTAVMGRAPAAPASALKRRALADRLCTAQPRRHHSLLAILTVTRASPGLHPSQLLLHELEALNKNMHPNIAG
jgi:hypothetical protein